MTNHGNENREKHESQTAQQDKGFRGSEEQKANQPSPDNRLKDGTNDFQNGDQEPTSERSSDKKDQSPKA